VKHWVPWAAGLGFLALLFKPSRVLARGPGAGLVAEGRVSSPYGPRQLSGESVKMHQGIDIAAPVGTEIRAVADGTVADVSPDGQRSGYGNTVLVEHPSGQLTLYAHMQKFGPGIRVGLPVDAGMVLGYVGTTHAPSTAYMAPHLHFEVLKGKVIAAATGKIVVNPTTPLRLEPQTWLRQRGVSVA
jgi:murein DD-endopeptidase MepM/ murein hydrolase activator NlpD